MPGFGFSLGFTLFYLSAIVLIPLAALIIRPWELGWSGFWAEITQPRVLAALKLSFGASAIAAAVNSIFGLVVAWVLVRYRFPGKRIVDALVDLPFARPTAVAGIALSALYAPNGWLGAPLAQGGIKVAYTPTGVMVALIFIGLPFVVRTLQPVLSDLSRDSEEAAATLGATRMQTFRRVILPSLAPTLLTGTAMAFARAVGEIGAVVIITGNIPYKTEVSSVFIFNQIESSNPTGASAVAVVLLAISFGVLLAVGGIRRYATRHERA